MPVQDIAYHYASLEKDIAKLVMRAVEREGVPVTMAQAEALVDRLYPRVTRARRSVYHAQMIELGRQAALQGVELKPAPLEEYPRRALLDAVTRVSRLAPDSTHIRVETLDKATGKLVTSAVMPNAANRHDAEVVARIGKELGVRTARHVKAAGRKAVEDTVHGDSARFSSTGRPAHAGYARVVTGAENCAFCLMLASRGAVYSEDTAVRKKDGGRYHDGCDCIPVLVVDGQEWEGEAEYKALEQKWREVTWEDDKPASEQWTKWQKHVHSSGLDPKNFSPIKK